jgi:hypothetical protein
MVILFRGSKYLEYISSITIMHNYDMNQTKKILDELIANAQIKYNTQYNRQNVQIQGWTAILEFLIIHSSP